MVVVFTSPKPNYLGQNLVAKHYKNIRHEKVNWKFNVTKKLGFNTHLTQDMVDTA